MQQTKTMEEILDEFRKKYGDDSGLDKRAKTDGSNRRHAKSRRLKNRQPADIKPSDLVPHQRSVMREGDITAAKQPEMLTRPHPKKKGVSLARIILTQTVTALAVASALVLMRFINPALFSQIQVFLRENML